MCKNNKFVIVFIVLCLFAYRWSALAAIDHIEGLEYVIRKIDTFPSDKFVSKRFDLYELYFENRANKTFSIPGYSIDLGINYFTLSDVQSLSKDKSAKKLTFLNLAAGAASVAFGGVTKTAANTAVRSVNSLRQKRLNMGDEEDSLSNNKTFIIYPNENISLFFFLDKDSSGSLNSIKFICRDEELNQNFILINNKLAPQVINAGNPDR